MSVISKIKSKLFSKTDPDIIDHWDSSLAYAAGKQIIHNDKLWIANAITLAGEEPEVSSKWDAAGSGGGTSPINPGTSVNGMARWNGSTWVQASNDALLTSGSLLQLGGVSNNGQLLVQNNAGSNVFDASASFARVTIGGTGIGAFLRLINIAGEVVDLVSSFGNPGVLELAGPYVAPTADTHLAPKKYVDDNAGGITPSAFIAEPEAPGSISALTITKITMKNALVNDGSDWDDFNNWYSAPAAGNYAFSVQLQLQKFGATDPNYIAQCYLTHKNSSGTLIRHWRLDLRTAENFGGSFDEVHLNGSMTIALAVGDRIELSAFSTEGGVSVPTPSTGTQRNAYFSGHRIS